MSIRNPCPADIGKAYQHDPVNLRAAKRVCVTELWDWSILVLVKTRRQIHQVIVVVNDFSSN
jgi:hypothetical protein